MPFFFFVNDAATTEIYTLSLTDALPIFPACSKNCAVNHVVDDFPLVPVMASMGILMCSAAKPNSEIMGIPFSLAFCSIG